MRVLKVKVSLKFLKKLLSKKTDDVDRTPTPETLEEEVSPKSKKQQSSSSSPAPEPPEECPICHDPVGLANPEGIVESWTQLYCGHRFGTHCIQTWLQESLNRDPGASPSCPICRATAKHPCGHLVSPPLFPSIQLGLGWQSPRPPPSPPQQQQQQQQRRHHYHHNHHQPVRRRLTRRAGHPLRPPPQPLRRAQVVGECRTCAENAEFDARVHKLRERQQQQQQQQQQRQQTGESTASAGSRSAAAIKSIIPGLKRSTHTVRTTVVHMGVDPHHHEGGGGTGRQSRATCYGNTTQISSRGITRRPTPPPSYNSRRLSI
ncbi:hypothetical protein F4820DRAFT_328570 [Hypoxylon rubiginosum]|uniref:Uncharacterized protein n=1 Tax=Hypoxylon rubiginosum TaxID=110542 RepID=A0ACB9YYX6_9PEZI|nr:hypothetical protein F4820DRAFT_328570 [Hypoxylon rubiginosum]